MIGNLLQAWDLNYRLREAVQRRWRELPDEKRTPYTLRKITREETAKMYAPDAPPTDETIARTYTRANGLYDGQSR